VVQREPEGTDRVDFNAVEPFAHLVPLSPYHHHQNPKCFTAYEDLKLKKKYKYLIFSMSNDFKEIIVEEPVEATSEDASSYEKFVAKLPEKECRWAVYDMEFDLGEGKRNKLVFVSWTPDDAPVKQKMVSASSKDALRRSLVGIAAELQATDYSEVTEEAMMDKVSRR